MLSAPAVCAANCASRVSSPGGFLSRSTRRAYRPGPFRSTQAGGLSPFCTPDIGAMKHFGPHICARCKSVLGARVSLEGGLLIWNTGSVRLSRNEEAVFEALLLGKKTNASIVDHVYAFDPNGGPDDAVGNLQASISKMRKKLIEARFPGSIKTHWGIGYTLLLDEEEPAQCA